MAGLLADVRRLWPHGCVFAAGGTATLSGACCADGCIGSVDPRRRKPQSTHRLVAGHPGADVVVAARLGSVDRISVQCCCDSRVGVERTGH